MLFMLNGIKKLKPGSGKMAIIQNGSSLFNGDAGSGPSDIRKYIIENDWLDAVVQLPNDSFYNTPITTYIWIIDKAKPQRNPGTVLLIDASKSFELRKKNIGNKRVDITKKCRELVVKAYGEYASADYEDLLSDGTKVTCKAKVLKSSELGYSKVTVETPEYDKNGKPKMKKGKLVPDTSKRDVETIPLCEDINEFIEKEVKPFNSDAWIDESKTKVGYDIPFTKTFYEFVEMEDSHKILERIENHEAILMDKLHGLLRKDGV